MSQRHPNLEQPTDLDWDFHDSDTRELTHSIHRYSGKFIPQVARQAIELLTEPGDLVLDPYCGSGTTLLEAFLLGRRSVGVDLSPLAVLISKVKVRPIPLTDLHDLLAAAESIPFVDEHAGFDLWGTADDWPTDPRLGDPWYTKWFSEAVLHSLVAIDRFILQITDDRLADVARVAMSDILRKVSRAHQGFPNVMFDRRRSSYEVSVRREYLTRLRDTCRAVGGLQSAVSAMHDAYAPDVIQGRAEEEHVAAGSIDAVITHPPYIASVPYAEYGALSLTWLGADPKSLDARLTGGRRGAKGVVDSFKIGYRGMMAASKSALRPGGHLFLLTGDPTVRGEVIDLTAMTTELAESLGFELIYKAQRVGKNRRANKMDVETVTIWRKS